MMEKDKTPIAKGNNLDSDSSEKIAVNEKPTEKLDTNSDDLTSILSSISLNNQQKEEVKTLLNNELQVSVRDIKSDVIKEGQEIKRDFLTIFGLFASFVTFLSIEVQVFKNRDNILELIGITSISLSFVMFFALVINDISKDKSEWRDFLKPTYVMNITFAILGVLALYIGGNLSKNEVENLQKQNELDKKEIIRIKKDIKELELKISKKPTR
jgi:mannose/fructose/N-acetylgalactosamine-specific phosphotransferase system component IIB